MKAYKGVITKKELVSELKKHQKADAFLRGTYSKMEGKKFKGCAVGCSLESVSRLKKIKLEYGDHSRYQDLLGIPLWLARVEDTLFEGISLERSKSWPVEFAQAINSGADLEKVKSPFLCFVLRSTLDKFDHSEYPEILKAINTVLNLYESGEKDPKKFKAAAWAVWDVSAAALPAAKTAASAADVSDPSSWTVRPWECWAVAATSVGAWTSSSAAAAAARTADVAARAVTEYEKFANHLIVLLKACK